MKHLKQCPLETTLKTTKVFTGINFGSATFPFGGPRMASKGRNEEQKMGGGGSGEVGAERWSLPSSVPPQWRGNAALAGTGGGSSRSFSLVHRHYLLFLKSVYNIYLYSVYIYIFIYIYRVYVHVLHRPLVATPGPALSVIAVPLLVALSCVVSGPDAILKVDKRVLHLVKEHH